MSFRVIDTNVVLTANGMHKEVGLECVAECAVELERTMKTHKLVVDSLREIVSEYLNKTNPSSQKRPGDAFVKWVLRNLSNRQHVLCVAIEKDRTHGFKNFPQEALLAKFDPADRKFVAVALAHTPTPSILQATDSKWLDFNEVLRQSGIEVKFLCPTDLKRFQKARLKKGSSL